MKKFEIIIGLVIISIGTTIVYGYYYKSNINNEFVSSLYTEAEILTPNNENLETKPVPTIYEENVLVTHLKTPESVQAIYASSWAFGSKGFREKLIKVVDDTDINAMVIDVKDSTGRVSFDMNQPKVIEYGSVERRIRNPKLLISELHAKDIYVIARIAVFQDGFLPIKQRQMAIQTKEGTPWYDKGKNMWIDQYSTEVYEYTRQIAQGAYEAGFDEINFDYIRFPSEGNFENMVYPNKAEGDTRLKREVIAEFLKVAGKPLREQGIPVSIDVYGYVTSRPDDVGIGQHLETLAPLVDFIAPMVYPSHYYKGSFNIDKPAEHPYEIMNGALKVGVKRLEDIGEDPNKFRTWIQDFNMGAKYDKAMVQKELKAVFDNKMNSYMVWNAANRYTTDAYINTDSLFTPATSL